MSTPKPRKPSVPAKPLPDLLSILWKVPLLSLPFAAFFLFVNNAPWSQFGGFYTVAMIFALGISLSLWVTTHAISPWLAGKITGEGRRTIVISAVHMFTSMIGAIAAALVVSATLIPHFFGDARGIAMTLLFSLMFGLMFMGVALAFSFYEKAMTRAGSERELQLARRIQRSFLLTEFPRLARLEVHAVNISSKEVSGDFYDVVTPNPDELLFAVADVSGKGVPAALLSSMLQASLRTQAGAVHSPAAMMATMNTLACQRSSTGQFATFFLASVHAPTLALRFSNGGHNFPVLLRADGSRVLLETGGLVIGMVEGLPWQEETLTLDPGDRVVVYTDGVTEAMRADGEMFGEERLYALLDACPPDLAADALVQRVLAGVEEFLAGVEPGDDITVMVLRVLPGATG